ncbi:MAG: heavy-metal-associated domain-containing protein [Cyanothece sp. SIO1E1]|nr:heavy-metal-associated domain-containing protein [Cyanothece sp. SIO1E1]
MMTTLQLKIPSMACAACTNTITKAVQRVDAGANVQADLATKWVRVETQASEQAVRQAIAAAGYPVD